MLIRSHNFHFEINNVKCTHYRCFKIKLNRSYFHIKNQGSTIHKQTILDGSCIAVGSHDNYVYLFESTNLREDYKPIGKCAGHSSFITHLDFSDDGKVSLSQMLQILSH